MGINKTISLDFDLIRGPESTKWNERWALAKPFSWLGVNNKTVKSLQTAHCRKYLFKLSAPNFKAAKTSEREEWQVHIVPLNHISGNLKCNESNIKSRWQAGFQYQTVMSLLSWKSPTVLSHPKPILYITLSIQYIIRFFFMKIIFSKRIIHWLKLYCRYQGQLKYW